MMKIALAELLRRRMVESVCFLILPSALEDRCKNSLGNGPKKFENRTWTGTQTGAAGASLEFVR